MSQNARPSEGYGLRIQQKESALSRVKSDFDRQLNVGKGRSDLFGASASTGGRQSDWARQDSMLRDGMDVNRSRLEGAQDNLLRAHQMAEETNEIGVNTLNDLRRQREQLVTAQGGMNTIEEKTSATRRILGVMKRRVIGNKLILGFIIFVLILGNFLLIFFKWIYPKIRENSKNKAPAPVHRNPPPPPPPPPVAASPVAATPATLNPVAPSTLFRSLGDDEPSMQMK